MFNAMQEYLEQFNNRGHVMMKIKCVKKCSR